MRQLAPILNSASVIIAVPPVARGNMILSLEHGRRLASILRQQVHQIEVLVRTIRHYRSIVTESSEILGSGASAGVSIF
jgi:hypothetical protein